VHTRTHTQTHRAPGHCIAGRPSVEHAKCNGLAGARHTRAAARCVQRRRSD